MNSYSIKIIHPEWGQQAEIPASGNNPLEALEIAVGIGGRNEAGETMTALVTNIATGFTVKIEYTHV